MKGLRKGYLFCQNWYIKGKGVGPWGGEPGGGGQVLGLIFRGYVSLASQSPYPIIVDSYYRPHLSHLGKYVIFAIPT